MQAPDPQSCAGAVQIYIHEKLWVDVRYRGQFNAHVQQAAVSCLIARTLRGVRLLDLLDKGRDWVPTKERRWIYAWRSESGALRGWRLIRCGVPARRIREFDGWTGEGKLTNNQAPQRKKPPCTC